MYEEDGSTETKSGGMMHAVKSGVEGRITGRCLNGDGHPSTGQRVIVGMGRSGKRKKRDAQLYMKHLRRQLCCTLT